jgi:hypothetical protein
MKTTLDLRQSPRVLRSSATLLGCVIACTCLAVAKPGNSNGNGKGKGQSPDFVPPGLADKGGPPGLVDKGVPPGLRRAPVEIIVTKLPPPLRVEAVPVRPSVKHVWVPGYWILESSASYQWSPGVWMLPPEPAAIWVPARVEQRSGVNVFISGFWRL